jgi:hypothetical protein
MDMGLCFPSNGMGLVARTSLGLAGLLYLYSFVRGRPKKGAIC